MGIMKENVKKIGIGVSEEIYDSIREMAIKEERSASQIIRKILRKYFEEHEMKKKDVLLESNR